MNANRTFSILLFSFIIALVGLTTIFFKTIPLLLSHAIYICQETFSNVIFNISHSIPLLLISFVVIILLIGVVTLWIQALKTRTYLKKHTGKKISIPYEAEAIIEELGLKNRIDIVKDESKLSFCYGLFQPRICLSTGLLRSLNTNELRAVLLHESYHLKNRDPLKIILGQTASTMFFFIPILKEIQHHYALSKEIAADNVVIDYGNKQSLIFVLNKLLIGKMPTFNGIAALAGLDDLEKRILYLTDNRRKVTFRPSLVNTFLSIIIIVFSFMIVNIPVYAASTNEGSMEHALFICPFGDRCTLSCKSEQEKNYSEQLLYTSAKER